MRYLLNVAAKVCDRGVMLSLETVWMLSTFLWIKRVSNVLYMGSAFVFKEEGRVPTLCTNASGTLLPAP